MATKKKTAKKTTAKKTTTKKQTVTKEKLSAIDAAAKVLAASKEPMNAKQLIEAMAVEGYWKSPGGKTPHATLYSAITREIKTKGKDARFKIAERGKFTINS